MWVTVLGRGIIESTLVTWRNYCSFPVELSAFPRPQFPLETALFVTGHPTSLWLTREMTVIQVLGYGCGAFLSLLFRGTLMLLCLAWRQWLRGQDEQSCDCMRCKYTLPSSLFIPFCEWCESASKWNKGKVGMNKEQGRQKRARSEHQQLPLAVFDSFIKSKGLNWSWKYYP